ncbi:hypothetical protein [Tenacibaculum sp. L6]|uniref:hypothetical protein n=1 Tax=Tenacibaculum sp. L6 TaxID=2992764 RepID=UPI00237B2C99|nr:hypothetical protein [Tenacibaculum sp. L6]MDE0536653.1 hypothetical protein [Tenacibaculum sp. L6]
MKKLLLSICFIGLSYVSAIAQTYEYKVITSVESIVPNGLGRSRLISSDEERNFEDFTSGRSEENDERNKSKRSEIRVKNFEETKLLNFFNIGGIRFQNIVANDAVITSKLNDMAKNGWELAFSNSGVESYGGKGDSNGIFITRYIFKREVKTSESAEK